MNILIDARKLGDGGIGTYIETLVDGLLELKHTQEPQINLTLIITPEHGEQSTAAKPIARDIQDALERWRPDLSYVIDGAKKYSLQELFLMPLRKASVLAESHVFHEPHYTLPFVDTTGRFSTLIFGTPKRRVATVTTVHDIIHVTHPEGKLSRIIGGVLIRSALMRAHEVITVSAAAAAALRKHFNADAAHLHVVPNSVPYQIEHNASIASAAIEKGQYLLFIGSDRPHKGFNELLEALKRLRAEGYPKLRLIAVGERYSDSIRTKIEQLGLNAAVQFVGAVTGAELAQLYHSAAANVIPSREEGFGLMAIESFACGCPVVVTPIPVLTEVVGECAWIAPDLNPSGLAEAISSLLSCPAEAQVKVEKGREWVKRFSRRRMALETLEVYRRAIDRANSERSSFIGIPFGRWRQLEVTPRRPAISVHVDSMQLDHPGEGR